MNQRRARINDRQVVITVIKFVEIRVPVGQAIHMRCPKICGAQIQFEHALDILSTIFTSKDDFRLLREQLGQTEADNWIVDLTLVVQYLKIAFDFWIQWIARWDAENALEIW